MAATRGSPAVSSRTRSLAEAPALGRAELDPEQVQ
jgi:hypothetical protein